MNKQLSIGLISSILTMVGIESRAVEVTVSIKPIHSLVSGVMGNTGTPKLLITGGISPHAYQMKPSDAAALSNAELIVWVGDEIETFLTRPISNLANDAHVLTLSSLPNIQLLSTREGGMVDDHHADENTHNHSEQALEEGNQEEGHHHDEEQASQNEETHSEDAHSEEAQAGHDHEHAHGEFDMHIWLSPINASTIVEAIAEHLSEIDPTNAELYQANAERIQNRIDGLEEKIHANLDPISSYGFITFHDAYQYFENEFGLNYLGTIAVDPVRQPGARRVSEIRAALMEQDIRCVFSEPQFSPAVVETIIEGTNVNSVPLDPLGSEVEAGENAWFEIIENMSNSFTSCLSG